MLIFGGRLLGVKVELFVRWYLDVAAGPTREAFGANKTCFYSSMVEGVRCCKEVPGMDESFR